MGSPLQILVVGAGSIGRRHLSNLMGLASGRELSLAAVDRVSENLEAAKKLGPVDTYKSLEDALDGQDFDAALICTPNDRHVSHAVALLEKGCHLFVEKPIAVSVEEAEKLNAPLAASGKRIMVGCNLRFHPGVKALATALGEGIIGRPLYARAWFAHYLPNWRPEQDYRKTYSAQKAEGGGILLDAIHEPDFLVSLFGPVRQVSGTLLRQGDLEIDVEDTAIYSMTHAADNEQAPVVSNVHVDYLRRDKSRGCEICGTDGTLVWHSSGKNPESVSVRHFDGEAGEWRDLFVDPAFDLNRQYIAEMEHFLDRLGNETAPPVNGLDEASHVMQVIEGVRASSVNGQPVSIYPQDTET